MKKSIKRIYSRFIVLTTVVVFGAIAIAQAQREHATLGTDAEPTAAAPGVEPTFPLADLSTDAGEPADAWQAFAEPIPRSTPDDSSTEHQDSHVRPASWQELESDDSDMDMADSAGEPATEPAGPPPMLPEPMALPEESADTSARRNPYRGRAAAPELPPLDSAEAALEMDDRQVVGASRFSEESAEADAAPPLLSDSDLPPLEEATEAEDSSHYAQDTIDDESAELPPIADEGEDFADVEQPLEPTRQAAPAPSRFGENRQAPNSQSFGAAAPAAALPPAAPARAASPSSEGRFGAHGSAASGSRPAAEIARRSQIQSTGKPGPQTMEGPQTPTLTLQKLVPNEIQVGQAAKFEIRVRNVGRVPAENVLIRDEVPVGTSFVDASPKASPTADGTIYWEVGSLAPGQEISVTMQVMPETEGQIGSVATVSFEASASARTRSTKPDLVLEHSGPVKVLMGDAVRFSIKLSNPGSGAATNVVLEEDVPAGLSHSSGAKLEYEVGTIEPGQTRHLELTLKAAQAGHVVNTLFARADAGLEVEDVVELDVVAPQLQVSIEGPNTRYLDRQATFTVAVANPGTATATDVELIAYLPEGLKFVSTNNSGYFDQSRNAVVWSLEQLPAGEMGKAQFTAMPVTMGSYRIRAEGQAKMGLRDEQEHTLEIEGLAALLYVLSDKVDPIEISGQTTYEIKVVNQGSKEATNVRFAALVPDGMVAVSAAGPTTEQIQGQQIVFAPILQLAPKAEAIFEITVQGKAAGDHRFRVQMTSDEISTPVIKEESTRVFAD